MKHFHVSLIRSLHLPGPLARPWNEQALSRRRL
jgi:hypothetical protein